MHNLYVKSFLESLEEKHSGEIEYLNACKEILESIDDVVTEEDEKQNILERLFISDRIITFKVTWTDDLGKVRVNTGYRVQQNNALGTYKGGLRFSPTVNLSILKFLAIEQVFKNALTGIPMGGAKGGSDFDPKGKSDNEIKNFCQSFMTSLYRHIGASIDVPAGDLGVGAREISYMYGAYKKITLLNEGVLTGKNPIHGGSLTRKEATGYGLVYFASEMLKAYHSDSFEGKKVIISGSGNVSIYAAEKAIQLGATVVAMSDSAGYIYREEGLDLNIIKEVKEVKRARINDYLNYDKEAVYKENSKDIFSLKADIVLPCATQNEIDLESAKKMVENNVILVAEGANMPTSLDAISYLIDSKVLFGPAKAANAGGVSVSGLEMTQNAGFTYWSFEEVDEKLKQIMKNIFKETYQKAALKNEYDLLSACNKLAYRRVADAIIAQGL